MAEESVLHGFISNWFMPFVLIVVLSAVVVLLLVMAVDIVSEAIIRLKERGKK